MSTFGVTRPGGDTVTVVVLDAMDLFRRRVVVALEHDATMEVPAEASTLERAHALVEGEAPRVVVAGSDAESGDPTDMVREALQKWGEARVIAVAPDEEPAHAMMALTAGARGVIGRDHAAAGITQVVHQVAGGGVWLPGWVAAEMPEAIEGLDESDRALLGALADGGDPEAAAERLGQTPEAVDAQLATLLERLASGR